MPTLGTKRTMARASGRNIKPRFRQNLALTAAKPELKYRQVEFSASPNDITLDGANLLEFLPQGTGRGERVGSTIRVKRIEIALPATQGSQWKGYMYSRNGAVSQQIFGGNQAFVGNEPDIRDYRIWSAKNHKFSYENIGGELSTSDGPACLLRKNFGIPMKVSYAVGDNVNTVVENGIFCWAGNVPDTGTGSNVATPFTSTTTEPVYLRIWFYDA